MHQSCHSAHISPGPHCHSKPLAGARHALESISERHTPSAHVLGALESKKAARQLGTLGGGNHFLEVWHLTSLRAGHL